MNKKIIFVSSARNFITNTFLKNLSAEGFDVIYSQPSDVKQLLLQDTPDMIILYLDHDKNQMQDIYAFVLQMLQGNEIPSLLYLIGSDEELDQLIREDDREFIEDTFARPLNVAQFIENLQDALLNEVDSNEKRKILVVDDDGTMLRTLKLWLSDKYHVYMANSGKNAMSLLERNEVDLILLDYEMPEVSGPEVLMELRKNPRTKDVSVMFLTAKNDEESIARITELQPEKYLLKTMPPEYLLESLDSFFA